MERIVSLDIGRRNGKLFDGSQFTIMPSCVGEWRERNLDNPPLDDEIDLEFQGEKFFVGNLALNESNYHRFMMVDDKVHRDTLILALALLHMAGIDHARVITGLPITFHRKDNKKGLKELLRGSHNVVINGQSKNITIRSVDVVAEGGGAFWSDPKVGLCRIIDGGSKTINCCSVRDKRYIDRESDTLDFGFETNKDTNHKELVKRIAGELGRLNWKKHDRIFTAGGEAETIAHFIKPYFSNVIPLENPIFANAIGFYQIGRLLYDL